jgi:cell wall-associated NlpC family hydrolase
MRADHIRARGFIEAGNPTQERLHMHAHKHVRKRVHVRKRLGAAALALAASMIAMPQAQASPAVRAEAVQAFVPKKSKRLHWGRYWGWSRPAVHHAPTVIEIVLAKARAQLGKPYVYGSAGPNSFDCSGLTQFVYAAAGIALPHNAAAQYDTVRHVAMKDIRPGDLVFYGHGGIGHVGLYVGGGKMIHAPYTGTNVQVAPLQSDLVGAGRPAR